MTSQGIFNLEKQKILLESSFREIFNSLSMSYENQLDKRKVRNSNSSNKRYAWWSKPVRRICVPISAYTRSQLLIRI